MALTWKSLSPSKGSILCLLDGTTSPVRLCPASHSDRLFINTLNCRGVQPTANGLHVAQDGYECGLAQNHKFTSNIRFFVITCHNIFNMWPKRTLLPVWPRDAKSLDTPDWLPPLIPSLTSQCPHFLGWTAQTQMFFSVSASQGTQINTVSEGYNPTGSSSTGEGLQIPLWVMLETVLVLKTNGARTRDRNSKADSNTGAELYWSNYKQRD